MRREATPTWEAALGWKARVDGWRPRVRRAIEEAEAAINEVLMRRFDDDPWMGAHSMMDVERNLLDYGGTPPHRPWPRRRFPQAARYFPADGWVEVVIIAFVLALLLLAAVAFVAPAMLPAR